MMIHSLVPSSHWPLFFQLYLSQHGYGWLPWSWKEKSSIPTWKIKIPKKLFLLLIQTNPIHLDTKLFLFVFLPESFPIVSHNIHLQIDGYPLTFKYLTRWHIILWSPFNHISCCWFSFLLKNQDSVLNHRWLWCRKMMTFFSRSKRMLSANYW